LEAIINISEICHQLGVKHAVLSPGSRNAPLTISFARHKEIECISVPDERSAGFIALGLATTSKEPVILCCTSGTALANYLPSIIEAKLRHIPLVVMSADRPLEWIGQGDGQAIHQHNIYGDYVKRFFEVLPDYENKESKWLLHRTISEAVNLSMNNSKGPVHINIPFREPFYPNLNEEPNKLCNVIIKDNPIFGLSDYQIKNINVEINNYQKVLVVAGENSSTQILIQQLELLGIPCITDCNSNLSGIEYSISHHDTFLTKDRKELDKLVPDLIITIGEHFISKNLKVFLRKHKENTKHWHIGLNDNVADIFQCLSRIIQVEPIYFFNKVEYKIPNNEFLEDYLCEERKAIIYLNRTVQKESFNEFINTQTFMNVLPDNSILFVGNSMPIRYVNIMQPTDNKCVSIYANRGSSGIDGTSSTAVGIALKHPNKIVTLLVGDIAFLYDKNAFWVNPMPSNLRIIVSNNAGGGIFNMIKGPGQQPELETYFMTKHDRTAQQVCKESGIGYYKTRDKKSLIKGLEILYKQENTIKLLEVFTSIKENTKEYEAYKKLEGYGE